MLLPFLSHLTIKTSQNTITIYKGWNGVGVGVGGDGGRGTFKTDGIHIVMTDVDVQQRPPQHCKAIQLSSVAQPCLTFCDPVTAARQASLSITNSRSMLKLMSIEQVMPSSHLILCHPLLLPSTFPSVRVFPNESVIRIKCQSVGVSLQHLSFQ